MQGKNDEVLNWARNARPGTKLAPATAPDGLQMATFAGGCFWGLELAYQRVPGVVRTSVGYTQGKVPSPTYEAVCSGGTGHTEAVQVYYDPAECSYESLIDVFFDKVDPTTLNRQGNDRGTQYRSGIYWHTEAQRAVAEAAVREADAQLATGKFRRPVAGTRVVAELAPAVDYWLAEDYHQQYLAKGGRWVYWVGFHWGCIRRCGNRAICIGSHVHVHVPPFSWFCRGGRPQSAEKGCTDKIRCCEFHQNNFPFFCLLLGH
jgi:peptide-methionine (S)-S-oxide reductase